MKRLLAAERNLTEAMQDKLNNQVRGSDATRYTPSTTNYYGIGSLIKLCILGKWQMP